MRPVAYHVKDRIDIEMLVGIIARSEFCYVMMRLRRVLGSRYSVKASDTR